MKYGVSHVLALAGAAMIAASVATGCSKADKWTLKGTIDGADKAHLAVEVADNGRWLPMDTFSTDSRGRFSYSHAPVGYPDIYRLVMDGNAIYFPVDSTETVTITASADNFGKDYSIAGNSSARMIQTVDSLINGFVAANGVEAALTDSLFKRELTKMILADPASVSAYYIVCKQIGGQFLYNPAVPYDNRILGAVANAYSQKRPDDPRTRFLSRVYLGHRRAASHIDSVVVTELPFFDIELMDNTGATHKLSDVASRNKTVVLNFTAYTLKDSPAYNLLLSELYSNYRTKGLEIYQVSIDDDEFFWKSAAKNIPWITVYCAPTASDSRVLNQYNVTAIPTTYIISDGELVDRVDDLAGLPAVVAKYAK